MNTLQEAYLGMTANQLNTILKATKGLDDWFTSVGQPGKGKMVVSVSTKETAKTVDYTLAMNFMAWLHKYIVPVEMPSVVYRIHDIRDKTHYEPGQVVKVTPRKPILSWSETDAIKVTSRDVGKHDVVLKMENPRGIFSYKMVIPLISLSGDNISHRDANPDDSVFELTRTCLRYLHRTMEYVKETYLHEKEIVVYHGTKPFTATLLFDKRDKDLKKAKAVGEKIIRKLLGPDFVIPSPSPTLSGSCVEWKIPVPKATDNFRAQVRRTNDSAPASVSLWVNEARVLEVLVNSD